VGGDKDLTAEIFKNPKNPEVYQKRGDKNKMPKKIEEDEEEEMDEDEDEDELEDDDSGW